MYSTRYSSPVISEVLLSFPAAFLTSHTYFPPSEAAVIFTLMTEVFPTSTPSKVHEKVFPGPPSVVQVNSTTLPRALMASEGSTPTPPEGSTT